MKTRDLLSFQMDALWFTYLAVFLFALLPNFGPRLGLIQIFSISALWVVLVNIWSMYSDKPVIDERKQEIAEDGMTWAFVTVSLMLVAAGSTGTVINHDLIVGVAEMGLWTWIVVFSFKNLCQRYGGAANE